MYATGRSRHAACMPTKTRPSYHDPMTLHEALEHQLNGTLPERPPLSAPEAIEAVLRQDMHGDTGWRLTAEARRTLAAICAGLRAPPPAY